MNDEDLWATVVGQDAAVSLLRATLVAPVHAFLFVGPPGAGRAEAARAFAGALFAACGYGIYRLGVRSAADAYRTIWIDSYGA